MSIPSLVLASGEEQLSIVIPVGPSAKNADPAIGWDVSRAGITETLFSLDFEMRLKPYLAEAHKNLNATTWEIKLRKGIGLFQHS